MRAEHILRITYDELADASEARGWNDEADWVLAEVDGVVGAPPPVPPPVSQRPSPIPPPKAEPPVQARVACLLLDEPCDRGFPWGRFAMATAALVILGLAIWTQSSDGPGGELPVALINEHPSPAESSAATDGAIQRNATIIEETVPLTASLPPQSLEAESNEQKSSGATESLVAQVSESSVETSPTMSTDDSAQVQAIEIVEIETVAEDTSTAPFLATAQEPDRPRGPVTDEPALLTDFDESPAMCESGECGPVRDLGTQLVWAENVNAAAELANEQSKLVYLIHVSGNFEIPDFT